MSVKTKTTERSGRPTGSPGRAVARLRAEGSFTLIETLIALAIMAVLIVQVASVQGSAIVFSDYGRNITQASYLAQRVMAQVEYYWKSKPFPELETTTTDAKFDDNEEYTYSLEIKEWKFPFLQLLQSSMGGGQAADGEDGEAGGGGAAAGMGKMLETVVDQVFGKEPIFMTAHVEVFWSEGAARNSTGLTYLLTNQARLDDAIIQLKPVWDRLTKPPAKKNDKKGAPGSGPNPAEPPPPPPPPPPPVDEGG